MNRREFIVMAGAACLLPAGAATVKPLFRIGLLTDTHIGPRRESCVLVKGAMRLFREKACEVIVHCGDLADLHYVEGYRNYRAEIEDAFPAGMKDRPDFLYVHANHDIIDPVKARDPKQAAHRFMDYGEAFAEMDRLLGAEQGHFVEREYHGFPLLVFPQEMNLVGGYKAFEEKVAEACAAHPGKPVFICVHTPPSSTTYNSGQWGNATTRQILDRYPQVVCFGGHIHNSLRNELCIWQEGGFAAVDVGCLQQWEGIAVGSTAKSKKAYEAMVAEIFADNTVVIRRYDVRDGSEIRPDAPWTVPLKRAAEMPGAFAAGAKLVCAADAVPFSSVRVTFPAVTNGDDVLFYRVEAARKTADGWVRSARCDVFDEFYLAPSERTGRVETTIGSGYFDAGEYRITATPVGFRGAEGCPLETVWTVPEKVPSKLLWSCAKPMEELKFRCGWTHDAKSAAKAKDVPVADGWAKREAPTWAVLPDGLWNRPKGTKLRFTADLRMRQDPKGEGWNLYLRAMDGTQRCACGWITSSPKDTGVFRAVFDFTLKIPGVPYHFGIMQGGTGTFRIESLKLEEMK